MQKVTHEEVKQGAEEFAKTLSPDDSAVFMEMVNRKDYKMAFGHFPKFAPPDGEEIEFVDSFKEEVNSDNGLTAQEQDGKSDEQLKHEADEVRKIDVVLTVNDEEPNAPKGIDGEGS